MFRKIGIFGGSFDPPHFGHLALATCAKEHFGLDEIWFVPVFVSPFKTNDPPVHGEQRLEMVKLLIKDHTNFKVLDFELVKKKPSYTVESLQFLKKKYPSDQFYLLLGQDALEHFLFWKNPEEIVELVKLVVAPRSKSLDLAFLKNNPSVYKAAKEGMLPMEIVDISSTEVRRLAKENAQLKGFMPKTIEDYINQNHLYK